MCLTMHRKTLVLLSWKKAGDLPSAVLHVVGSKQRQPEHMRRPQPQHAACKAMLQAPPLSCFQHPAAIHCCRLACKVMSQTVSSTGTALTWW